MSEEDKKMIGDYLGTIEEFIPGVGTYVEDGKIYAAILGKPVIDAERHVAWVDGKHPLELKVGDIVYGEVMAIRKNIVTVIVSRVEGEQNKVDIRTGVFVSNISDDYVDKTDDMFGIGDLVRGKVVKIDNGLIDISTKGGDGVVYAFCKACRHKLDKGEGKDKLFCTTCKQSESRKVANDYGSVRLGE